MSEEVLARLLQERGMTQEEYRRDIEDQIRLSKLVQREIRAKVTATDEEIAAWFNEHRLDWYRPEKIRIRHLLIPLPTGASADEVEAARARANALLDRVRGGTDFAALVRAETPGAAADADPVSGEMARGELFPALEAAAFALPVGGVSEPVQSPAGFHLVQVAEKTPAYEPSARRGPREHRAEDRGAQDPRALRRLAQAAPRRGDRRNPLLGARVIQEGSARRRCGAGCCRRASRLRAFPAALPERKNPLLTDSGSTCSPKPRTSMGACIALAALGFLPGHSSSAASAAGRARSPRGGRRSRCGRRPRRRTPGRGDSARSRGNRRPPAGWRAPTPWAARRAGRAAPCSENPARAAATPAAAQQAASTPRSNEALCAARNVARASFAAISGQCSANDGSARTCAQVIP